MELTNLKSSGSVMIHANNYNLWQAETFRPFLKGRVLEIGCGSGSLTELIAGSVDELITVDTKREAVDYTRQRMAGRNVDIRQMNVFSEASRRELGDFDSILFCNVLEHIDDDLEALKYCRSYLEKRNGTLVLLVPAHQFIYGTLDEEVGHRRRYSKSDIRRLASQSGFRIQDLFYFNSVGAVGWFVNYGILKRRGTNEGDETLQVGLFDRFCVKPTRFIESLVRPPFGISVISVMVVSQ